MKDKEEKDNDQRMADGTSPNDALEEELNEASFDEIVINDLSRNVRLVRLIPSSLRRQPMLRFLTETVLIGALFSALWFMGSHGPVALAFRMPAEDRWRVFTAVLGAIFAFSALVFYGTSFAVTPARLLLGSLRPLLKLLPLEVNVEKGTRKKLPASGMMKAAVRQPRELKVELQATKDAVNVRPNGVLSAAASSAALLAKRMEQRTNTHLILGVGMGLLGLLVWYLSFFASAGIMKDVSAAASAWENLLRQFLPRVTILVFIELLAGFFLRQYRVGVEDLKYFLELHRRADSQRVAYAIFNETGSDEQKIKFATTLLEDKSGLRLQQGETTTVLETMKAEKNVALEALTLLGEQLQALTKRERKGDADKETDK